ncbi:Uncharacterised protein [Chryseobacterium taklimakanense]|uniref:Lipoprotein n=1 Tax=Chryseobacterium taklimakanense TaxID=536441 RepID=A0A239WCD9_9FLAO|nr:hypothetical protein [Chryseobacterium taklimakanense]SNV32181.1 Uncharacterised protein [Chryseobacterium taklimakanense]
MKNIIIGILLTLISCKENTQKRNNSSSEKDNKTENLKTVENKLPYTYEDVKKYYKTNSDSTNYIVAVPEKKLVNFNSEEILFPIKENDFEIKPKITDKYFSIETFNFQNNISCKLIIYNTYGENDSKILNVQLNSYKEGILVDQLLLDCRFAFENQYYRTFSINKDKTIELVKYSINSLEYNETGDIVGEKDTPDINKENYLYVIDNEGKFVKK